MAYGCRLKVSTTLAVIIATAVLHITAIDMKEDEPPVEGDAAQLNYLIDIWNIPDNPIVAAGQYFRDEIVNYFANR